jgi:uncharacterized protein DUF5648
MAALCLWALTCRAESLVEFHDAGSGRYFLSSSPGETAFVDGGGAGRGWVRTGAQFDTCSADSDLPPCGVAAVPVCRFYGAPPAGSGSHFFTADPGECAFVKQSPAWQYEGTPFRAVIPDPATGSCPGLLVPVYRVYNRATNPAETRHRWTASGAIKSRMVATGWADEGIAFCALNADQVALRSFEVQVDRDHVLTSAECAERLRELNAPRSCIGYNNLPAPGARVFFSNPLPSPNGGWFFDFSGLGDGGDVISWNTRAPMVPTATLRDEARNAFVQLFEGGVFGIHVETSKRGAGNLTSVSPLY